jgi:hypothetical protein
MGSLIMELLDATIALAVTLAALATAVTVIMEIIVRVLGLKSKGQIDLFRMIFDRSFKNRFRGNTSDYDFVTTILGNPLTAWTATADPAANENSAGAERNVLKDTTFSDVFGAKSLCVYDWVSTEHVFRQLLTLPGVVNDSRDQLVRNLREFNVEYNQLCAAAKTRFKNNSHNWSVFIGLMLALVMNVNALRIYEAFMANPALTATMMAQMDNLVEQSETARARLEAAAESGDTEGLEEIKQRLALLQSQLSGLEDMGIPIGWSYAPHCHLVDALSGSDSACVPEPGAPAASQASGGAASALAAVIASLITGLLIGLGAPFWFDLAKRLAQIRSMFKGGAGADSYDGETPVSGSADYEQKSEKLITKLVDEALASGKVVATRKLLTTQGEI